MWSSSNFVLFYFVGSSLIGLRLHMPEIKNKVGSRTHLVFDGMSHWDM
jgi:hypothetical protein